MWLILIEGIVMCFILLIICVVGIANGPEGLVILYEQDVKDRAVSLGYTTKEKLRKKFIITAFVMYIPVIVLIPIMVYGLNGVTTFKDGFMQMTAVMLIMGLFDRFFIDWYWVGHTKAWDIKGTEDLKPYIPTKMKVIKWLGTLVMFPIMAAVIAWGMTFI